MKTQLCMLLLASSVLVACGGSSGSGKSSKSSSAISSHSSVVSSILSSESSSSLIAVSSTNSSDSSSLASSVVSSVNISDGSSEGSSSISNVSSAVSSSDSAIISSSSFGLSSEPSSAVSSHSSVVSSILNSESSSSSIAVSSTNSSEISSFESSVVSSEDFSSSASSLAIGQFIDSPVAGIRYTTTSRTEGDLYTDANGYFSYTPGDQVSFYLGNLLIGSALASEIVTPLDLAGTTDILNQKVINIARLLQTLDQEASLDGLQMPAINVALDTIDFTLESDAFASQASIKSILALFNKTELIDEGDALDHLSASTGVDYAIQSFNCAAITSYYCDSFDNAAAQWSFKPTTNNSNVPDGEIKWERVHGNGLIRHTADKKGGVVALLDPAAMALVPSADYAVEARFRPRMNGTTGNKQLYLLMRYQDGNNWYAGVLNVQNDTALTQVEIAKAVGGSISRMKQIKRPIAQGQRDKNDGTWYDLRIQAVGDTLKVYLDGELIATHQDTSFTQKGTIGIWTANKSFEFDDVRVVDPNQLPVAITIAPSTEAYVAEANDDPYEITVTATDTTGTSTAFTAVSSNPDVVAVAIDGNKVRLTPLSAGRATITLTNSLDSARKRVIMAEIAPEFVLSNAAYNLAGRVYPHVNATEVYEDEKIYIDFDSPVSLGSYGLVRIYDAANDALVDTISLVGESDSFGGSVNPLRKINTRPIRVDGNRLYITPHVNKLQSGKTYWVAFSESLIAENTLGSTQFTGLGKVAGWQFTVRATPIDAGLTTVNVKPTGSDAHFRSVQAALDYAMANVSVEVVNIGEGIYHEPLYLRERSNLIIRGANRNTTVVQYPNNNGLNASTDGRSLFLVSGGDNITLENFTIKNTTLIGSGGQAETVYFNSDNGRLIAKDMNFISEQDTILVKGWSWFYNSLIAGNVDFIWGYPKAALFEKSEIRTLGDSRGNGNGGYILQARVQSQADKGFVFLNSKLTNGTGPLGHSVAAGGTYLARSGGDTTVFDNIVFVNTRMDTHIAPSGWAGLGVNNQPRQTPELATATAGWREFGTMDMQGNSLSLDQRQFGLQLSPADVTPYCSRSVIFAGFNSGEGWNPLPTDTSDCIDVDGLNPPSSSSAASSVSSSASSTSQGSQSSETNSSSSSVVSGEGGSNSSSSSSVVSISTTTVNFTTSVPTALLAGAPGEGNTNFNAMENGAVAFDHVKFYSKSAGGLRYNISSNVGSINYNGPSFSTDLTTSTDISVGVTLSQFLSLTRYVSIPVIVNTAPITLDIKYANASGNKSPDLSNGCFAGLVIVTSQTGKVLKTQTACGTDGQTLNVTVTDDTVTEVFILMSRVGDGGGGIRISEITITQ